MSHDEARFRQCLGPLSKCLEPASRRRNHQLSDDVPETISLAKPFNVWNRLHRRRVLSGRTFFWGIEDSAS